MRTMKHIIKLFALSEIRVIDAKLTVHVGMVQVDELYHIPVFNNVVIAEDGKLYQTGAHNINLFPLKPLQQEEIIWDW